MELDISWMPSLTPHYLGSVARYNVISPSSTTIRFNQFSAIKPSLAKTLGVNGVKKVATALVSYL
jgi:hypothetical protein